MPTLASLLPGAAVALAATLAPGGTSPATAPAPADVSEPTAPLAGFGTAVTVDGGRIFVGNPDAFPFFPMPSARPGVVHVFEARSGGDWVETATLSADDVAPGDGFGEAVAAAGGWLAVGAPGSDEGRGAVYLFHEVEGAWAVHSRLSLTDGRPGDALGTAVAVNGERVFAGLPGRGDAEGAVAVFQPGVTTTGPVLLTPREATAGTRFGSALAVRGDLVAVGGPGATLTGLMQGGEGAPSPGAAWVFRGGAEGWFEEARLTVGEQPVPLTGSALAFAGDDELLVGAPFDDQTRGAILRFTADASGWSHAGSLAAEGAGPQTLLGLSLAVDGPRLLAGAPIVGQVVAFEAGDEGWRETGRIAGGGGQSFFGSAVGAGGGTVVVGAPGAAILSGLGYIYAPDAAGGGWARVAELRDELPGLPAVAGDEPVRCDEGEAAGFGCRDVDLVTFVPLSALGAERGVMVNDVWGWTDPETGHEWALVGRTDGMAFVDVTDPAAPFYAGELPLSATGSSNIWRDMKVYDDHVFVVADAAGDHGMQIFDLTRLRQVGPDDAPMTFDEDAVYTEIASAHNIVVNEESGFGYVVGASSGGTTCGGGLHMVDLRDPKNPTFAGCFQDPTTGNAGTGYSHDAQCVMYRGPDEEHAGSEICFGANETALSIADVTDKKNPVALASARYPNSAYLHQGWVSDDHRWFYMNDELDELGGQVEATRTLVWDIVDLDDPILVNQHMGTTSASDHNLYVRGDMMYQSNYVSGLRILDVSDPENPVEVAWFDTVPTGSDGPGFAGSWSNFPFFESGNIVVTSMREGLFVLRQRPRSTVF